MSSSTVSTDYDVLLAGFYGRQSVDAGRQPAARTPYVRRPGTKPVRPMTLSLSQDDGEVLVARAAPPTPPSAVTPPAAPMPAEAPSPAEPPAAPERAALPEPPAAAQPPAVPEAPAVPELAAPPEAPAPPSASELDKLEHKPVAGLTDSELLADMQRILSGQASYDPSAGGMVDAPPRRPDTEEPPAPPARLPKESEHAFFDQLAASMEYANSYDLGSMALSQRFDDFERVAALQRRAAEVPRSSPATLPRPQSEVGSAEFIQDLDAIHQAQSLPVYGEAVAEDPKGDWSDVEGWNAACTPVRKSAMLGVDDEHSVAMYDTGEHVLGSGTPYSAPLKLGPTPGVPFTYAQIVSLAGDLAETPKQLMELPVGELTQLKSLVERSTRFYAGGQKDKSLDVSHKEWDDASHERYLYLADRNDEHFAPHTLAIQNRSAGRKGNHKSAWERYHREAIAEAQRHFASGASGDPEKALVINAFGDHFLTDAFAAGHLFNKEMVQEHFKYMFYTGGSLNPAGEKFFERLAEKAFVGEVRRQFSALETVDYPLCIWGLCLKWRPDINSVSRFTALLKAAARQEKDKIANLAAKALHDHLNKTGLVVTNAAGDGTTSTWHLQGDGYLNAMTRAVMQKAVKQSVANILDPAIRASGVNVADYQAKVWRYTPQLTTSSQAEVVRLIHEYTNPDSTLLVDAAARVLTKNLDILIKELIREKKLKVA